MTIKMDENGIYKTSKKYLTNEGTVESFFRREYAEGYAYGEHNSNVYYIGNKLFSYGHHFVLAQLHEGYYFVNADKYSSSTGKHQSYVHRNCPARMKIEIPFSSLERAGIHIPSIEIIDKEQSKYVQVERKVDGEKVMIDEHLMGSTLFKTGERYFLSGIDETAKDLWNGFFLTELVRPATSVEDAYESLKPGIVKEVEIINSSFKNPIEVLRQGEYFFIKVTDEKVLAELKIAEKNGSAMKGQALKHYNADKNRSLDTWEFRNSRHVVTRYAEVFGDSYAKGTCRHVAGEHRMLKLDGWHLVIENTQKQSWSSDGRVD